MSINITVPENEEILRPKITVIGVGGGGGNAVNNMIRSNLEGVDFIVANTDSQALAQSLCDRRIQIGLGITRGLGGGAKPEVGRAAAEENLDEITNHLQGSNMVFVTAGLGGATGSGAAPVIAQVAREQGILTVGVVTKPFHFEGKRRMDVAEKALEDLQQHVDTLIVIPNQNLFRVANESTTFAEAFNLADDVLHSGVRGVTDLIVMPGLINLDFADIRTVMSEMGKAMMGTGEAEGDNRAIDAAEAAISNPLLEDATMKGARGVLINITGGMDMTLFEVDEAANRIRDEVDADANIIFGSTFDEKLEGKIRISVVATGIDAESMKQARPVPPQRTPQLQPTHDRAVSTNLSASLSVSGIETEQKASPRQPEQPRQSQPAPAQPHQDQPQQSTQPAYERTATAAAPTEPEKPAFIAEAPMQRDEDGTPNATQADPFTPLPLESEDRAEPTEETTSSEAGRPTPSLFERFTGLTGSRRQPNIEQNEPQIPTPESANDRGPNQAPEQAAEPAAAPSLESNARSEDEDETLEIPAFLRRQIN